MAWRTLDGGAPRIIAHRGASGLRPEHTLEGYALALSQGADIIEPDLVVSADGVLFARHDPGLARSTDIRLRPQFASRQEQGDWPVDRFAASEIDQLRAIQPNAARSSEFDRLWPLLNAMLNVAGGATWVSLHHGGGVGMGYSQHSGVVIVADGTEAAAKRLARVLWNDPGTGVMRHADAGYEIAIACAREQKLQLPMIDGATG